MTAIAVQTQFTPEDYLAWERKAPFRNEYLSGQILAMSGASLAHNLITGNTFNGLYNQLMKREYEIYISKMRVKARPITSYFYPDVVVVCDEPRFEDDMFDTLLNPTVVVEVLSHQLQLMTREKNSRSISRSRPCKNTFLFHKSR